MGYIVQHRIMEYTMTEIRTRTRQPSQQAPQPAQNRPSLLKTGAQAEAARTAEAQKQEVFRNKRYQPFRLWVSYQGDEAARTKEFIMLDSSMADCPAFYEHSLPDASNDGKRTDNQMCLKELEHCPLCEKFGDSYYVQMASVMELLASPWTRRDGTVVHHVRKLLPIKYTSQEWFNTTSKDTFGGNMRGAHIITTRDASQRSPAVGTPRLMIENGQVVKYSEEQLLEAFGHDEVKNRDGKVIKQADADVYPYKYDEIFVTPTAADLRRLYGGVTPAGSQEEVNQAFGGSQEAPQVGGTDQAPAVVGIQRRTTPSTANGTNGGDVLEDPSDEIPF